MPEKPGGRRKKKKGGWGPESKARPEKGELTWRKFRSTVPSSFAVGNPACAPAPAVALTIVSGGPVLLTPCAFAPPPAPPAAPPPPNNPPKRPPLFWRALLLLLLLLLLAFFVAPPAPAPAPAASRLSSWPTPELALFCGRAAALPWPMNTWILVAASMGPPPWVRPSGVALPDWISLSRMMAVSACEPQPLEEQSRGVPSATGYHG